MNATAFQLKEVLSRPNPQNFWIRTNSNQRCRRCPGRCHEDHYSLEHEYSELRVAVSNIGKYKTPTECFKHQRVTYHPRFNCEYNSCIRCGNKGHTKEVCNNKLYYWNRLYLCGCNGKICKQERTKTQSKGGNHCCNCLKPIHFKDAITNYQFGKIRCNECHEKKTRRPPTPDSDVENKRSKTDDLPEPEDPLQSMEIDPKPSNKGKGKERVKCINCNREERTMNPINELGICMKCEAAKQALETYGSKTTIRKCTVCKIETDEYQSRAGGDIACSDDCNHVLSIITRIVKDKSKKPQPDLIREKVEIMVRQLEREEYIIDQEEREEETLKLTNMVTKFLNGEYKDTMGCRYPKDQITNVLNEVLPREMAEIVTDNLQTAKVSNTEPIKTNMTNIEWSEGSTITQPWELTKEFEWKDQVINDNYKQDTEVEIKTPSNQINENSDNLTIVNPIQNEEELIEQLYCQKEINKRDTEIEVVNAVNRGLELRIIELQGHIADQDFKIEKLERLLDETQSNFQEAANQTNANAMMVYECQNWNVFLERKGIKYITKYTNIINDQKEEIEKLREERDYYKKEMEFGNILFDQMVELNLSTEGITLNDEMLLDY